MLIVTTRPLVRERLRSLAVDVGLSRPVFVDRLEQVLEESVTTPLLFIDLGSCATDEHLEPILRTWDAYRPGTVVLVLVPLLQRDIELQATVRLARCLGSAEVRVMTASDFHRAEVWRSVQERCQFSALHDGLREEFIGAVRAIGRVIPAEPIVIKALSEALEGRAVSPHLAGPVETREQRDEARRKALWRLLRKAGQMPPSHLQLVFQLLWYVKLKSLGWSAGRIAALMGFREPRELRMVMKRRLGIGMATMNRICFADALTWAAVVSTLDYSRLRRLPARALVRPLLHMSNARTRRSLPLARTVRNCERVGGMGMPTVSADASVPIRGGNAPEGTKAPLTTRKRPFQPEPPVLP